MLQQSLTRASRASCRESAPSPEPTRVLTQDIGVPSAYWPDTVPRPPPEPREYGELWGTYEEAKDTHSTRAHTRNHETTPSPSPSRESSSESVDVIIDRRVTSPNAYVEHDFQWACSCHSCILTRDFLLGNDENDSDEDADKHLPGAANQEYAPITPQTRFERYGPFPFMRLPGELRNAIYTTAINDELNTEEKHPPSPYRPLSLTETSSILRRESRAVYAIITHFTVPFRRFETWCTLVGKDFMGGLRQITITFPSRFYLSPSCDLTRIYRFRCLFNPRATITIAIDKHAERITDHCSARQLGLPPWKEETEADIEANRDQGIILTYRIAQIKPNRLMGLLEAGVLSDIVVDYYGTLRSVQAKAALWLTYEDLKESFGVESDFRLEVNDLPWKYSSLAVHIHPKTTRENVTMTESKGAQQMAFGKTALSGTFGAPVQANAGFNGFSSFASLAKTNGVSSKSTPGTSSTTASFGSSSFGKSSFARSITDPRWASRKTKNVGSGGHGTTKQFDAGSRRGISIFANRSKDAAALDSSTRRQMLKLASLENGIEVEDVAESEDDDDDED